MKKKTTLIIFLISSLLFSCFADQNSDQEQNITGPISLKNLSIFLIHGEDNLKITDLLTLQEAIEQKKIIIHETQNVSELSVENISNNYIFIQSGDIVKGGKQDRVIQYDLVVKPNSGSIPISSFCVEEQRWSQRGQEDINEFNSSSKRVTSKKLKIAAKQNESQQEVWDEVKNVQEKLSGSVEKSVNNSVSASSLQLTLEDEEISKYTKEYIDNISKKIKEDDSVIGYVFAINGEINSADIYSNAKLFRKMWPKLLEACAIEAVSDLNDSTEFKEITKQQIVKWLDEVEVGELSNKSIEGNVEIRIKDSENNVLYETNIEDDKTQWIHKNMIKK